MITDIQILEILKNHSKSGKDGDSEYVLRSDFRKVAKAIQATIEKNQHPMSDIFRCIRLLDKEEGLKRCRFQCEHCHEYFFQVEG